MTAVDPLRTRLNQLAALRQAATPGPWEASPLYPEEVWGARGRRGRHRVGSIDTDADAALIVAAVNAVAALLSVVRGAADLAELLDTRSRLAPPGSESDAYADAADRLSALLAPLTEGNPT